MLWCEIVRTEAAQEAVFAFLEPMITPADTLLIAALMRDEGVRYEPYKDTADKWTVGVGRNLEDVGLQGDEWDGVLFTDALVRQMLQADIAKALDHAQQFDWFAGLNDRRQRVVVNMIFNLGVSGFRRFRKMIAAIESEQWMMAAAEGLDSRWATQVGSRATRLMQEMRA